MKQFLLTLIFSFGILPLFSQIIDSAYDISLYINPDYSYRSLDADAHFIGNNQLERYDRSSALYKTTHVSHNINADLNYIYYKNTRKSQSSFNAQFHFNPAYKYNNKSDISKYYTLTNDVDLNLDYTIRKYHHSSAFFSLITTINNQYNYNKHNNSNNNSTPSKYVHFSNKTNIELSHGHGRIENISNAWRSYLIWEDLSKSNLINENNSINTSDITELADLFASINSTRYFDIREYNKWKFKSIFNKLSPKTHNDINVMASLQDLLGFGYNQYRYSGQRFSYGVKPEITLDLFHSSEYHIEDNVKYGLFSTIKYERYKPLNIKWQWDIVSSIDFGLYNLKETEFTTKIYINNVLSYFPTTRTSYKTTLALNYNSNYSNNNDKLKRFNASWQNSVNYYFSPRLRGSFNLSLYYVNYNFPSENFVDSRSYRINYEMRFNYAIF